uniref:Uncharacterized protein n=1 Tax=Aegilops tauschii subsp. strangulata TaxID=200361 RepID=A0A453QRY0_AEGTS
MDTQCAVGSRSHICLVRTLRIGSSSLFFLKLDQALSQSVDDVSPTD